MGPGAGGTVSPRAWRGVALFFGIGVTFKIFKRVCVARGLATGQTVALVLERGPEGPLRGALEDHGGGVGVVGRLELAPWYLHTRMEDSSYFNHQCGHTLHEFQPSLCRRESLRACMSEGRAQNSSRDSCRSYI